MRRMTIKRSLVRIPVPISYLLIGTFLTWFFVNLQCCLVMEELLERCNDNKWKLLIHKIGSLYHMIHLLLSRETIRTQITYLYVHSLPISKWSMFLFQFPIHITWYHFSGQPLVLVTKMESRSQHDQESQLHGLQPRESRVWRRCAGPRQVRGRGQQLIPVARLQFGEHFII